ncbi:TPA: hypothetical protein ACH45Z_001727 [Escherichia coli]|nr:hypothetical protein [Escherichia coli]EKR0410122.1 hypothetical protein [Escherichia coli]EMA8597190.1 hypothetical protein [Escherichia coli]EME1445223.1 hypothetical protein [Escherichia coli]EME2635320.1 hypothetical protein [Escherichia coli]
MIIKTLKMSARMRN